MIIWCLSELCVRSPGFLSYYSRAAKWRLPNCLPEKVVPPKRLKWTYSELTKYFTIIRTEEWVAAKWRPLAALQVPLATAHSAPPEHLPPPDSFQQPCQRPWEWLHPTATVPVSLEHAPATAWQTQSGECSRPSMGCYLSSFRLVRYEVVRKGCVL